MVKVSKYLILIQVLLLNIIGHSITQCAARIQTTKEATEQDLKLINAAEIGCIEKVEQFIKQGANINAINYFERTALMLAASNGHKKIVELLIKHNVDVNFASSSGWTALIYASIDGYEEIVKLLINAHVDVNFTGKHGWTTLMYASEYGHIEIVELLLYAGANMELKNKNGEKAIEIAKKHKKPKIVQTIEDEPSRRDAVIENFIKNNQKWIKDKYAKEITESTSGLLIADIANIIAQYAIEYTDIPLEYKLSFKG